jgi:hypothetical protein
MNGVIPVVAGVEVNTFPVWTSRAASSASAPWRSYSCSTRAGRPGAGGLVGWHRARAWMEGFGVHRDDLVARPQPFALVVPLVKVEDDGRLGGEVRVARVDPRSVLPRLDGVLGQDPQHRGRRDLAGQPRLRDLGGQFRSAPAGQWYPVAAGSWQASAIALVDPGLLEVAGRARGRLESWQKWSFPHGPSSRDSYGPAGWQLVSKSRRISRFSLAGGPTRARVAEVGQEPECAVELTEVHTRGGAWWTLGFEATGPVSTLRSALEAAATQVFAEPPPGGVELGIDDSTSYARWLALAA